MSQLLPGIVVPVSLLNDSFGRATAIVHPTQGTTTRGYDPATGQVLSESNPASGTVAYSYYPHDHASAGLASSVTGGGQQTRYAYDALGRQTHQWGGGALPVKYEYHAMGRLWKMHTYRGGTGWDGAVLPPAFSSAPSAVTTWTCVPGTDALERKTDAADQSVAYTYDAAGRLATRTDARGIVTTYAPVLTQGGLIVPGRLDGIGYSDATPGVSLEWYRSGEIKTVTDAAGVASFQQAGVNAGGGWLRQVSYSGSSGLLSGLQVVRSERDADRPLSVTASLSGTTLLTNSYEWRPNGDIFRARQSGTPSGRATPWNGTGYVWERNLGTGRVSKISDGWVRGAGVTYGLAWVFEYDAAGRVDKLWYGSDPLIGGQPSPRL